MPVRKTNEQFVKEVFDLVGEEYTFFEDYKISKTPILVRHNKCGYEYRTKPAPFLRGHGCPKCAGLLKKTTEMFTEEVRELTGGEYSVLGEYKKNNIKIKMRHNECGNIFMMEPVSFTRSKGRRCPKCSLKNRTKNDEQFIEEANFLLGKDYAVLGKYINAKTKIKMKHNLCNREYLSRPSKILEGFGRCPYCKNFKVDLVDYIEKNANNEYRLIEKYIGYNEKIRLKHNICSYEFSTTPSNFMSKKSRCPMCAGVRITSKMFEDKFENILGKEYALLSEYKNAKTKIRVRHEICGNVYEVIPNGIIRGSRCPLCSSSHGEHAVRSILDEMGIIYRQQFKTNMCKRIGLLPFDFGVYDKNDVLILLIEYDGEQHFEPVEHFGGEQNFKTIQSRDRIKDSFCDLNNIPLLRIPYWEFDDLEYILFDCLIEIGLIKDNEGAVLS